MAVGIFILDYNIADGHIRDMATLTEYLKAQGETQESFARRAKVSQAYVAKLCRQDPRPPSIQVAARIEVATAGAVPMQSWVGKQAQ